MWKFLVFYSVSGWPDSDYVTLNDLPLSHLYINSLSVDDCLPQGLDTVFYFMQGENWSPNGEQRERMIALGMHHTSMSVGDVIYAQEDGSFYVVEKIGFKKLEE